LANEVYVKESGSDWYSIETNTKLEFKRKIRFAQNKKTPDEINHQVSFLL